LIIVNAHNNSTKDQFRKMKEPNLFLDILPALNKTSTTLKTVLPFHLNSNGKHFIQESNFSTLSPTYNKMPQGRTWGLRPSWSIKSTMITR